MNGLVHGKPQDLKKGLGAGGDLPGGLNPDLSIIPANRAIWSVGVSVGVLL